MQGVSLQTAPCDCLQLIAGSLLVHLSARDVSQGFLRCLNLHPSAASCFLQLATYLLGELTSDLQQLQWWGQAALVADTHAILCSAASRSLTCVF